MKPLPFRVVRIFKQDSRPPIVEFTSSVSLDASAEIQHRVYQRVKDASMERLNEIIYCERPRTDWVNVTKDFTSVHLSFSRNK